MNALCKVDKKFIRLEVDKWGKVAKAGADVSVESVNTNNNISEIEFVKVPTQSAADKDKKKEGDQKTNEGKRGGRGGKNNNKGGK